MDAADVTWDLFNPDNVTVDLIHVYDEETGETVSFWFDPEIWIEEGERDESI